MENPLERKPVTLIIILGAIVLLILGAGIISTYYNNNNKTPLPPVLPDSPYSIAWEEANAVLFPFSESTARPVKAKYSLLDIQRTQIFTNGTASSADALALTIDAFILDLSSSTSKTCIWKLPFNLKRVVDESGTLAQPTEGYFESTQSDEHCAAPGSPALVEKNILFPIRESERDFLFTTDDPSHILFLIHLGADGTISVEQAPREIPG